MIGSVYDRKYYLLQNAITGRGSYQVIEAYRNQLSMSMERWDRKTKAGKEIAMNHILTGNTYS